MTKITREIAGKVLAAVDAGLARGVGRPVPGQMCVEAAVCYAMGLPHGDRPSCVAPALRTLKIVLNDSGWSSKKARARGMRRLALAQLGSANAIDEKDFLARVAKMTIKKIVPCALRQAAKLNSRHAANLESAARKCESSPTQESALAARGSADAAAYAAATDAYAYASATDAYAYASADAAAAAASAAYAVADAVARGADAYAVAAAAATAAARGADAYTAPPSADAYAAADAYTDKTLSFFAEEVVQILVEMKAPGCQWLELAPPDSKPITIKPA